MEAPRRASEGYGGFSTLNKASSMRCDVIFDREANKAELEDERRAFGGSSPVFCTFGSF